MTDDTEAVISEDALREIIRDEVIKAKKSVKPATFSWEKPERKNFDTEEEYLKALGRYAIFSEAVEKAVAERLEKAKKKPEEEEDKYKYVEPTKKEVDWESFDALLEELEKGKMPKEALEGLKRWREEQAKKKKGEGDSEKAKKKPKEYYYYKKPVKKDFEDEEEFKKAKEAYDRFVAEVTKEILENPNDAIKKSVTPPKEEGFNLEKLWEVADEATNAKELFRMVEIE